MDFLDVFLVVVALIANFRTGGAVQDFPLLTNMLLDVCGVAQFEFTPTYPCQYHLLSLSYIWSECSEGYADNIDGFRSCVIGCVEPDMCQLACKGFSNADAATGEFCTIECSKVLQCTQDAALRSAGPVSAETLVRKCFHGRGKVNAALVMITDSARRFREQVQNQVPHELDKLLRKGCNLRTDESQNGGGTPWAPLLRIPNEPPGLRAKPLLSGQRQKIPMRFEKNVQELVKSRHNAAQTLPKNWNEDIRDIFLKPRGTPPPGPAVPLALSSEHWWFDPKAEVAVDFHFQRPTKLKMRQSMDPT